MHKERFDDYGKGKGLSGRDAPSKGKGTLPGLVGNQSGYVDGYKNEGTYKSSPKQKRVSLYDEPCSHLAVIAPAFQPPHRVVGPYCI